MLLDTCFLIALQRELKRGIEGPASGFLNCQDGPFSFSMVTRSEFMEGYGDDRRLTCERFLRPFRGLSVDSDTAWICSRTQRRLRAAGTPIGDHDTWIAATALQFGLPLVTRNMEHFNRVEGLAVIRF